MLRSRGDADLEQNKQNIPHGSYSIAVNSRSELRSTALPNWSYSGGSC